MNHHHTFKNWEADCYSAFINRITVKLWSLTQLSQQTILKSEISIRRFKISIRRFTTFSSNKHPEVQFPEWFLGLKKNDHKKLAIRKKSTILGFLPSNFNTQLVTPIRLQEIFLAKIDGHLPPKIKVQRESQLYGTNGIFVLPSVRSFVTKFFFA